MKKLIFILLFLFACQRDRQSIQKYQILIYDHQKLINEYIGKNFIYFDDHRNQSDHGNSDIQEWYSSEITSIYTFSINCEDSYVSWNDSLDKRYIVQSKKNLIIIVNKIK